MPPDRVVRGPPRPALRGRPRRRGRGRRTERYDNRQRNEQYRTELTEEQTAILREQDRQRRVQQRENMTDEERDELREQDRQRRVQQRENMTDESERDELREQDRQRHVEQLENMTDEERVTLRELNRQNQSQRRAVMDDIDREELNRQNRETMASARALARRVHVQATARTFPERSPDPLSLGSRNVRCESGCGALLFAKEAKLSHCCAKGKIRLDESQALKPYDHDLKLLLLGHHPNSRNFFEFIRRYNSAVSFASMGATYSAPPGRGPYSFRICGAIHHRISNLHPESGTDTTRKFGQVYILEGDGALQTRMNNNTETFSDVMFLLQRTLETCNPYSALYKNLHTHELEEMNAAEAQGRQPDSIRMIFRAGPDRRRYNAPTTDEVAAVFVGEDGAGVPGKQDFCIYPKARDALLDIPGRLRTMYSTDTLSGPVQGLSSAADLNNLLPPGFPAHQLHLKESFFAPPIRKICHVRLLKVVDRYPDIEVNTRLDVIKINNDNIICKLRDIDSDRVREVILYRESFSTMHRGSMFIRHQYPVCLEAKLEHISSLNRNLDPLVYPIFFHCGETGYDDNMPKHGANRRASMLQYYAHRLAFREQPFSPLHYGRKLFQQYVVDAWVRVESNRLRYPRYNQARLRTDLYSNVIDYVNNAQLNPDQPQPGRPVILPSSITGTPRYMKQQADDALALCTECGKPAIFLTMTCNPNHPDIVNNLGNHEGPNRPRPTPDLTASDRPDIVASVFKQQLDQLKEDLKKMFGAKLADIHVVEYQKRGLPHAHILIWLKPEAELRTAADIDTVISAEIPDRYEHPELYRIVTTNMIHGPCGNANPNAVCMVNGKCSKKFPKTFQDETQVEVNGYPLYRRRNDGRYVEKNGVHLDNRHVVPYCPYLLLKYNCHINTEVCASIKAIKYLFKYVYKGHDCASMELRSNDEIQAYIDARYVSAPESMWRLNEYPLSCNSHTVVRLDIHEENQQSVTWEGDAGVSPPVSGLTKLQAWFLLNSVDSEANQYLYSEIPKHYRWETKANSPNVWMRRVRSGEKVISRVYNVFPRQRERFFLRMLLFHVRGAKSFADLRTFSEPGEPDAMNVTYGTYEEACRARGLLLDDNEWHRTLEDVCNYAMPGQIRDLFVTLLANCDVGNPRALWDSFKEHMSEDFVFDHDLAPELAEQYALRDINSSLLSNYRLTVASFNLIELNVIEGLRDLDVPANEVNVETEAQLFEDSYRLLNVEQKEIVDTIVNDIERYEDRSSTEGPRLYFIDAPGGTGKTFVCNTLIAKALSMGLKVASCAWTGIAGNLLRFGQTVHSLTKLPVPLLETSTCNIAPNSKQAEFIRSLSLIFIDEASMVPLHGLRAIDLMLRDITGSNVPFGGKLLLFAGDFRQTLPVIPRANPAVILENCMNRSPLWRHFTQMQLTQNMRASPGEQEFCQWLLDLGEGRLQSEHPDTYPGQIDIPDQCNMTSEIVQAVYPNMEVDVSDCIILTPKNVDTHVMNEATLNKFRPDIQATSYFSTDKHIEDDHDGHGLVPTMEFLHSQTPSGLPLHHIKLKVGCPIMLLRNLDVSKGLCNGTRLKVLRLTNRFIEAEIIGSTSAPVFIPRINLTPSDTGLPFKFQRTQFPVRLCYCMTINKSQGQTFRKVGLYLPQPVFSHGQLYVGCSRARSFSSIYVQISNSTEQNSTETQGITRNIVWNQRF